MATEIEHKYLVDPSVDFKSLSSKREHIMQGYLSSASECTVRVRVKGKKAYITIKGITLGASRKEYEYEIPVADAEEILQTLSTSPLIDKIRHEVWHEGMKWEVDEFLGRLKGLVIAEIELPSEDTPYSLPPFVTKNVTGDKRFYNSMLAKVESLEELGCL